MSSGGVSRISRAVSTLSERPSAPGSESASLSLIPFVARTGLTAVENEATKARDSAHMGVTWRLFDRVPLQSIINKLGCEENPA